MKIKYKLILMFIFIILFASLPISLFILHKQEQEKIAAATQQGNVFSAILSQSVLNVILANGAEIKSIQIDLKEMMKSYKTLANFGMIFADAILISPNKDYNGIVLTEYYTGAAGGYFHHAGGRVPAEEINRFKNQRKIGEIIIPGINDVCYEFISVGSLPGKRPLCIGRIIFSKSIIVAPIKKMHRLIYYTTAIAIILVGAVGFFFSRFISKPIDELISATHRIEKGDLTYRIPIRSRDELGSLSGTFNQMLAILDLKIDELKSTNVRLTHLDVLKDEFLANISHELRTPLNGIIGISESLMLGATGALSGETCHDLSLIVSSGRRLAGLVNDILDFSKLKHQDINLEREPVNMHNMAQLVISIVRPLIEQKPLSIENNINPQLAIANGDKNRIQQILLNLVSNAIQFTEKGSIIITAGDYEKNPEQLAVSVSDTGIGIAPEHREKIFESFEQVNGPGTRRRGAIGLGLAITRKLVELHGGSIWVDSTPGKGSVFTFILDKSYDAIKTHDRDAGDSDERNRTRLLPLDAISRHRHPLSVNTGAARKKILVVDDEPVNLQVIINHLTLEGYEVITADDGPQALAQLAAGQAPDLLLLDIMLPGISGFDICRKIRESRTLHELPIIILTAKNNAGDIVTGLKAGANDYITKPVNSDELIARVQSLISMKDSVKDQNELNILRNQMDIATDIQKTIIPAEIPHLKNIDFAVRYELSDLVGGDLYDYYLVDDKRLMVLVADVAGHGIPAAMVSAMLQVVYTFHKAEFTEPPALFTKVNDVMSKYTHGLYLTACCVYIDLNTMKMRHANAGHRPLLIWRREEKRLIQDKIYERPIGIFEGISYTANEIDIKNNDRIIMYTDGIIEARNADKVQFGDERLHSLIREKAGLSAGDFSDCVIDAVKKWAGKGPGESCVDDITLVVMDIVHLG